MRNNQMLIALLLVIALASGCLRSKPDKEKISIATAANMQFAMEELIQIYQQRNGTPCELIVGSSGKLTAQISQGAPFDLFLAANMKYPEEVARQGRAGTTPRVYAHGRLVLWAAGNQLRPSMAILATDSIRHVAIANPQLAPYGQAAMEVLQHHNLAGAVQHKLVYGESIAQVNQFVQSGAAEIGFTALSMVLSPAIKGKGSWVALDTTLYTPIEQGVVLLERKEGIKKGARDFYDFLFTDEARVVLKKFGYSVGE